MISFVVQNMQNNKTITIFNNTIGPGNSLDLMQIPGISEEDIRASCLKGDLYNKLVSGVLKVTTFPEVTNFANDLMNVLGPSSTIRPVPIIPAAVKNLTNNSATSLFQVDLSLTTTLYNPVPDYSFSAKLFFAIECTDGYDTQIREGDVNIAAVMRQTGTGVISNAQAQNATSAVTNGTLNCTFSWLTVGTIATLQITPASSLTPTDLEIHYFLLHATHRGPAFIYL